MFIVLFPPQPSKCSSIAARLTQPVPHWRWAHHTAVYLFLWLLLHIIHIVVHCTLDHWALEDILMIFNKSWLITQTNNNVIMRRYPSIDRRKWQKKKQNKILLMPRLGLCISHWMWIFDSNSSTIVATTSNYVPRICIRKKYNIHVWKL